MDVPLFLGIMVVYHRTVQNGSEIKEAAGLLSSKDRKSGGFQKKDSFNSKGALQNFPLIQGIRSDFHCTSVGLAYALLDICRTSAISGNVVFFGCAIVGQRFLLERGHAAADDHVVTGDGLLLTVLIHVGNTGRSHGDGSCLCD
jgi:hypothetical protein